MFVVLIGSQPSLRTPSPAYTETFHSEGDMENKDDEKDRKDGDTSRTSHPRGPPIVICASQRGCRTLAPDTSGVGKAHAIIRKEGTQRENTL